MQTMHKSQNAKKKKTTTRFYKDAKRNEEGF
jgi:hypothetical protein